MNQRHLLMGIGLAVAAWLAFVADKTPSNAITTEPGAPQAQTAAGTDLPDTTRTAEPRSKRLPIDTESAVVGIQRLRERSPFVAVPAAQRRNFSLFGVTGWDPPPPKAVAAVPQAPKAPPLPYTYLGKKFEAGRWEVFLALGENARVAREHSRLDEKYRIDSIAPPTLSLTYLPLMQVQTLNIGTTE